MTIKSAMGFVAAILSSCTCCSTPLSRSEKFAAERPGTASPELSSTRTGMDTFNLPGSICACAANIWQRLTTNMQVILDDACLIILPSSCTAGCSVPASRLQQALFAQMERCTGHLLLL